MLFVRFPNATPQHKRLLKIRIIHKSAIIRYSDKKYLTIALTGEISNSVPFPPQIEIYFCFAFFFKKNLTMFVKYEKLLSEAELTFL